MTPRALRFAIKGSFAITRNNTGGLEIGVDVKGLSAKFGGAQEPTNDAGAPPPQ